jgi:hypothetical protein
MVIMSLFSFQSDFSKMTGPYLGQKPPGKNPKRFADSLLSSLYSFHQSIIVFTPNGKEAYWQARAIPEKPNTLGDDGIYESKYINGYWTTPRIASFSIVKMGDINPFISPDGKKFFFISKRPVDSVSKGYKIWVMDKTENGWSEPRLLPPQVNSLNIIKSFSVDGKYNLYFAVWNTIPRYTELDIYCSRFENGRYSDPEKLGPEINQPDRYSYSDSPFISPDGSYLIFTIRTFENCRLFISFREKNGSWTQARDLSNILGEKMNCSNPFVTFDGKFLFFIKLLELDGEYPEGYGWVDAKFIEELRPGELK